MRLCVDDSKCHELETDGSEYFIYLRKQVLLLETYQ